MTKLEVDNFYPLVLQYHNQDGSRSWVLKFRQKPLPDITFEGDTPTSEEITETLMYTNAPVWMIAVVDVIVRYVVRSKS